MSRSTLSKAFSKSTKMLYKVVFHSRLCSMIERLSYDLEKLFVICFTDQCLARLKQSFSLFPPRKLLIWAVNSSIAQSHYCISNDVKERCRSLSRKFHEEMTLFASAFAKGMKLRARLFLFDKPIKCFAFLFTFCFYIYFSWSYESRSIAECCDLVRGRSFLPKACFFVA